MARHIHFVIEHPGHRRLVTRLFFKNDPALGDDEPELAVMLEEVRRDDGRGWITGFEFVLSPAHGS